MKAVSIPQVNEYGQPLIDAGLTPFGGNTLEQQRGMQTIQLDVDHVVIDERKCPKHGCKGFRKSGRRWCVAHLPMIPVSAGGNLEATSE